MVQVCCLWVRFCFDHLVKDLKQPFLIHWLGEVVIELVEAIPEVGCELLVSIDHICWFQLQQEATLCARCDPSIFHNIHVVLVDQGPHLEVFSACDDVSCGRHQILNFSTSVLDYEPL